MTDSSQDGQCESRHILLPVISSTSSDKRIKLTLGVQGIHHTLDHIHPVLEREVDEIGIDDNTIRWYEGLIVGQEERRSQWCTTIHPFFIVSVVSGGKERAQDVHMSDLSFLLLCLLLHGLLLVRFPAEYMWSAVWIGDTGGVRTASCRSVPTSSSQLRTFSFSWLLPSFKLGRAGTGG